MPQRRIGLLTSGGDCPGLNAVIRAVVRFAHSERIEVVGFRNGWRGVIEDDFTVLDLAAASGLLHRGGSVLGCSRVDPLKSREQRQRVLSSEERHSLMGLIAVGGDGTLSAARELHRLGLRVVGIPKTIDNDIRGTDVSFGFDTAVSIVTEAIDRLHSTAESHQRVIVVEVMGRYAGWIALFGGLAGGADLILIPERPWRPADVVAVVERRRQRGRSFSIVVVAEGASPEGEPPPPDVGKGAASGAGQRVASDLAAALGIETRLTVLGHVQRGGSPTAFDRILATRFGVHAVALLRDGAFGQMVALQGNRIVPVPLAEATAGRKTVPPEHYADAAVFFA